MNRHAILLALLSAALFGVSTPVAKALLGQISPTILAHFIREAVRRQVMGSDEAAGSA
jgi:uncharacterized membrane protein